MLFLNLLGILLLRNIFEIFAAIVDGNTEWSQSKNHFCENIFKL